MLIYSKKLEHLEDMVHDSVINEVRESEAFSLIAEVYVVKSYKRPQEVFYFI